jgi:hypothetical protein
MNESLNSNECSVIDIYPFAIVAASSGVVSALCCVFVICLIFLLKKHHFFIQRMILYHCLASLVDSFGYILGLQHLGYRTQSIAQAQDTLCTISGFITLLASWILIVDYSVITFTLLMTAVFHKNVMRLEPLYVVMIFVLPLTFTWIPFVGNSYGEIEGRCWIRNFNYDDCTEHPLGEVFIIVLWNVPLFSILIVLIPVYLFTIAYATRERCRKTKNNSYYDDPEMERLRKNLIKDVWRILFFPFGLIFLNLFVIVTTVYNSTGSAAPRSVELLHGAFSPLQGGYIALVYILDGDTLRRLTYSNIRAAMTRRNTDTVHEYPFEAGLTDSAGHTASYTLHNNNNIS